MKRLKLLVLGCALAILLLIGAILFGPTYGPYVREIGSIFLQMASSADKESPNWYYSQARVLSSEVNYLSEAVGSRGTIKMQYLSATGSEHQARLSVYSLNRELSEIETGDTLRIRVCKHDPLIITSTKFKVRSQSSCVASSDTE